jgi:hypothetical protein
VGNSRTPSTCDLSQTSFRPEETLSSFENK